MTSAIPIVDLEEFNLTKAPEDVSDDVQRQLAAQIIDAFSTVGFVGLTNYGIPQDKDPSYFKNQHTNCRFSGTRCLNYPAITSHAVRLLFKDIKPNQIRCGEHSDYGSITLLFQDDVGGLQVAYLFNLRTRDGQFVPATPKTGTIYVNVGLLLQRWTSDKLIATVHRVVIPEAPSDREKVRMSIAYFVQPDPDCLVQCLDGSDKYEPITSLEFLKMKLKATYPE
ncbi:hypothetical protein NP493_511g00014 [Ridgeia piscesae]|uniref:Fe2OG dioxygenase domain-containing protein n=1 Tax=Ridgeia piscesae TaxID=27915 RepID=A0AAD9NSM5_RIDPI|nr:hypothetical protein NP493_511g00014 [Ridgeia piscesae]